MLAQLLNDIEYRTLFIEGRDNDPHRGMIGDLFNLGLRVTHDCVDSIDSHVSTVLKGGVQGGGEARDRRFRDVGPSGKIISCADSSSLAVLWPMPSNQARLMQDFGSGRRWCRIRRTSFDTIVRVHSS